MDAPIANSRGWMSIHPGPPGTLNRYVRPVGFGSWGRGFTIWTSFILVPPPAPFASPPRARSLLRAFIVSSSRPGTVWGWWLGSGVFLGCVRGQVRRQIAILAVRIYAVAGPISRPSSEKRSPGNLEGSREYMAVRVGVGLFLYSLR